MLAEHLAHSPHRVTLHNLCFAQTRRFSMIFFCVAFCEKKIEMQKKNEMQLQRMLELRFYGIMRRALIVTLEGEEAKVVNK